jgi:single-stranded-DNA-specific exonuclease
VPEGTLPPLTVPEAHWTVRPSAPPDEVERLVRAFALPPLVASVLWTRGLRSPEALQPPFERTRIPALTTAAERLAEALERGKRILIHGDYDADGISGTAVLTLGLRALGGKVTPFIPNRLRDGYGVHPARVAEHAERAELFVTVDCGISNRAEVAALQAAGVEVIVTDHHHPGQVLPDCLTVHPSLSPYAQQGLPELTGAGVAYHLLWALHEHLGLEAPVEYSDLAAIGTVADVAPLMGENRALVTAGLTQLAESRWPGLRAMMARTLSHGRAPSARDVAFVLAPRLNAAGRLGEADLGLELLTTASERRALELASYLDARNADRRRVQDEMLAEALKLADPGAPALVLEREGWHPGVMGIVASKLLERFYRPVFIVAQGKGSVRSTPGISAVGGLEHAGDLLERFGGHSQAAGFAIRPGRVDAFRERVYDYALQHPTPQPQLVADALLAPSEIDPDLYRAICSLEPYGQGHPAPRFALTAPLEGVSSMGGGGKHLSLRVGGVRGVAWNRGEDAPTLRAAGVINAAVSLRENTWQGKTTLEFLADGVRAAQPLELSAPLAEGARAFYRTPPPEGVHAQRVQEIPLSSDLLRLTEPLEALVRGGQSVHFDLCEGELARVEALPLPPTLSEVRRAFVCLQRGTPLRADTPKAQLCRQVLEELDLIDTSGRALRGQKRDPYSSESFVKGLMERYKLQGFLKAYRALSDAAFSETVWTLFGPPTTPRG